MTFITNPFEYDSEGSLVTSVSNRNKDAFGNQRVSQQHCIFDSKTIGESGSLYWTYSTSLGGTGIFETNQSLIRLQVPATSGAFAIRQTRQYMNYQPGRGQLIKMTAVMDTPKSNLVQRIGYYDDSDGVFIEQSGLSSLAWVLRSSTSGISTEQRIVQSGWNVDTFNGSGISSQTIDVTKGNIYWIDLQWLGVGTARCGFGTADGHLSIAHKFESANKNTSVYMRTGSLPLRYEIRNAGTTSGQSSLKSICSAVFSEGGFDPIGLIVSKNNGTTLRSVNAAVPMLSVRLKQACNRATIIPLGVTAALTSADTILCEVVIGVQPSGGTWVDNGNGTCSEYNITATAVPSSYTIIDSFYMQGNTNRTIDRDLRSSLKVVANDLIGTSDAVTIILRSLTGAANCAASLVWKEIT